MNFYGSALDRRNEQEAIEEQRKEFEEKEKSYQEKRELSEALLDIIESIPNEVTINGEMMSEVHKRNYKKAIMIAMRYANV